MKTQSNFHDADGFYERLLDAYEGLSPDEAQRLPPGTEFQTPDGRILRVPGGGGSNATGGFQP